MMNSGEIEMKQRDEKPPYSIQADQSAVSNTYITDREDTPMKNKGESIP